MALKKSDVTLTSFDAILILRYFSKQIHDLNLVVQQNVSKEWRVYKTLQYGGRQLFAPNQTLLVIKRNKKHNWCKLRVHSYM